MAGFHKDKLKANSLFRYRPKPPHSVLLLFGVVAVQSKIPINDPQRAMRADPPRITASTSESVAMLVSPGVVIASAPCATPH